MWPPSGAWSWSSQHAFRAVPPCKLWGRPSSPSSSAAWPFLAGCIVVPTPCPDHRTLQIRPLSPGLCAQALTTSRRRSYSACTRPSTQTTRRAPLALHARHRAAASRRSRVHECCRRPDRVCARACWDRWNSRRSPRTQGGGVSLHISHVVGSALCKPLPCLRWGPGSGLPPHQALMARACARRFLSGPSVRRAAT